MTATGYAGPLDIEMEFRRELKLFFSNIVSVAIWGLLAYRIMPNWEYLVSDVANSGAWVVAFIYHLIYGAIIGCGAVVSALILKKFHKRNNLYFSCVIALICSIGVDILFHFINANSMELPGVTTILLIASISLNLLTSKEIV